MVSHQLICVVLLLLGEKVSSISSPGPLTKEVGQHVVFMVNGTAMSEATWGILDGNTNDLRPRLFRVLNPGGIFPSTKGTSYAERVSFIGNLTKGQAWFKITNLNINDTKQYMAQIILQGESKYRYSATTLTVIPPATTTTTTTTTHSSITSLIPITDITQGPTTGPSTNPPILKSLTTTIEVDREFSQGMDKTISSVFKNFANDFQAEIRKAYTSLNESNFESVEVIQLRKGSILVTFIVFFKYETSREKACFPIENAIKKGKLGNFAIVPGSLGCSQVSSSTPRPPGARTGVHPGIIAGVAIVGFLAIAGLIVTIIYVCRKKASNKAYRSPSRPGAGYEMETKHGEPEEQYASVQRLGASGATQPHDQPLPQYAAVDKSKKKKKPKDPNELIYAQLDHDYNASMGTRPPSDRRPTSGSDTVYADIQSDKQKQRHPPPQYGNMQDISHA